MIDRGLAVSVAIVAAAVWLAARRTPARTFDPSRTFDVLAAPVLLGLVVGRLTAMALNDIGGLVQRPSDLGGDQIVRAGAQAGDGDPAGHSAALAGARGRRPRPWTSTMAK